MAKRSKTPLDQIMKLTNSLCFLLISLLIQQPPSRLATTVLTSLPLWLSWDPHHSAISGFCAFVHRKECIFFLFHLEFCHVICLKILQKFPVRMALWVDILWLPFQHQTLRYMKIEKNSTAHEQNSISVGMKRNRYREEQVKTEGLRLLDLDPESVRNKWEFASSKFLYMR